MRLACSSVNEGKYRVLSHTLRAAFDQDSRSTDPIQIGELDLSASPHVIDVPDSTGYQDPDVGDTHIEPSVEAVAEHLAGFIEAMLSPRTTLAGQTIRAHFWGILNAVVLNATNATSESINARIQRVKRMACGFRNRERFRRAIYFHLGGLDLYPTLAFENHTNS